MLFGEDPCLGNDYVVAFLVPHLANYGADHSLVVYIGAFEADVIRLVDIHRFEVGHILRDKISHFVCRPHGTENFCECA